MLGVHLSVNKGALTARLGNIYGPDATFLGVRGADVDDPKSLEGAAAVIVGAPFDGGTSRWPGCRFGPQAIRLADYLPHDGMRPHLALDVDPLVDLGVVTIAPPDVTGVAVRLASDPLLMNRRPL